MVDFSRQLFFINISGVNLIIHSQKKNGEAQIRNKMNLLAIGSVNHRISQGKVSEFEHNGVELGGGGVSLRTCK